MNIKELLTDTHIGKRVTTQSVEYGTISVGIYEGITTSEWTGEQVFTFTNGAIGEFPQTIFCFPVTQMDTERLLIIAEVI